MCSHEQKLCEKCGTSFECKPGNITHCQCSTVTLTNEEREFIASRYTDCLCTGCMLALKNEYHQMQRKLQLAIFLKGR